MAATVQGSAASMNVTRELAPFHPDAMRSCRKAGGCSPRCIVDIASFKASDGTYGVIATHNGQDVALEVGDLNDADYDAFADVREQWASKVSDLHREAAMQSDWPVF